MPFTNRIYPPRQVTVKKKKETSTRIRSFRSSITNKRSSSDAKAEEFYFYQTTKDGVKEMMQQTRMKYAWDITCEREFSDRQLKTINQISEMIISGGSVKDLQQKMRLAKIL